MNVKTEIKNDNNKYAQCDFCSSDKNIKTVQGKDRSISICKLCATKIYSSFTNDINEEKMKTVVKIEVLEYEKAWGSKVDDCMVCLDANDGIEFIKEFNSKNIDTIGSDWYMTAKDRITEFKITDVQFKELKKQKNKRMWLSSLKKIIVVR